MRITSWFKWANRQTYIQIHKHKPTRNSLPIVSVGLWTVLYNSLYSYAPFWGTKAKPDKKINQKTINPDAITQTELNLMVVFASKKQVPSLRRPTGYGYHSQTLTKGWYLSNCHTKHFQTHMFQEHKVWLFIIFRFVIFFFFFFFFFTTIRFY